MFVLRTLLGAAALAAMISPAVASAQSLPRDDFSAHRFYVAPGAGNFVLVDGGDVGPDMLPTFGATLGYAHRPFVADDLDCFVGSATGAQCETPEHQESDFVGSLLTLQVYGAFTFLERIQVGLNVPVVLFAEGEPYRYIEDGSSPRTAAPGGVAGGLSDPRISAKIRILDPDADGNGVTLAASLWVNVPLGHYIAEGHFLGDRLPSAGAQAIASMRFDDLRLAINVGGAFREEATNLRSAVGPELTWGVAGAYRFHPLAEVVVEATGATSFGARFDSEAPTELRGMGVLHLGEVSVHLGAGAGLVYGVGVPVAHVFAGARYVPTAARDSDRDGMDDSLDGCPTDAEDVDAYEDEDGCPDLDNDGDSIPDADDPCPGEAEDEDGFEDDDGCPDPDNDGDGISDGYDSCPDVAEDMDGDRDTDGCPDADADRDGIEDDADRCPNEAEDFDGLGDGDGCPEADFDEDGFPDESDPCPDAPEDRPRRGDGCPADRPAGARPDAD